MNKCLLCKRDKGTRPKFCSKKCIKQSWHLRNHPNSKCFNRDKEFFKTSTGIGFTWERYVANLLKAKHLTFNNGPDLDKDGTLIDVKACNLYRRKFKRGMPVKQKQSGNWIFNRNKEKPIDFFCCVCLVNNKPKKILMIPSKSFPKKGATIGWNSKYDCFSIPFFL